MVLRRNAERVRLGPWRDSANVAYLAPLPDAPPPSAVLLQRCLAAAEAQGYAEVVTAALSPPEQIGFLQAGFDVREHLHLLSHDLADLADVPRLPGMRRARKTERAAVLAVDNLAFDEFWQLDDAGLEDALKATPAARFRVIGPDEPVGYAISGRAGRRGYLQRLAVHPAHQGHGYGRALTLDGLHWMRRWSVHVAVVNTQITNEAAYALYRSVGFRPEPHGLAVLWRPLSAAPFDAPVDAPVDAP